MKVFDAELAEAFSEEKKSKEMLINAGKSGVVPYEHLLRDLA
jgi:hypothetical protein